MRHLALLALICSCSSSSPALDSTAIDGLTFGAPAGWVKKTLSTFDRQMFQWTPTDNDRKESLIVMRSRQPAAKSTSSQLAVLMKSATRRMFALPTEPIEFTTPRGVNGVLVEGTIGDRRRFHAVFADGDSLVNVLYTAQDPDKSNFEAVLNSFFRERS